MGMPITVEIVDQGVDKKIFKQVFDYFSWVDETFSPFKKDSEVSRINSKDPKYKMTAHMQEVIDLAKKTTRETDGYFRVNFNGKFDPSGLVKGWSIQNASRIIADAGYKNFFVNAGGDIQTSGKNSSGEKWKVGIRNPFKPNSIVKIVELKDGYAIATSGNYFRGNHIYSPLKPTKKGAKLVSLSIIGSNIHDADRFATAAFAMGEKSLEFVQKLTNLEAFAIFSDQKAYATKGFYI